MPRIYPYNANLSWETHATFILTIDAVRDPHRSEDIRCAYQIFGN